MLKSCDIYAVSQMEMKGATQSKVKPLPGSALMRLLRKMLTIREAEEWIARQIRMGIVKCPCHLAVGQEATPAVLSEFLTKTDRVYGMHRSHNHYLAMTDDVEGLLAEVLGKEAGCAKGMGGSQHLIFEEMGFGGSVPIVGATIPIAAGAALAMKMQKSSSIAVAFFGDGATEEGVLHETLNLASQWRLPVIFVCENNLFASHLHILQRQPDAGTMRFAEAHRIEHTQLDGNDAISLCHALESIVNKIRNECIPYFVEVLTYRWKGHVGYREDIDVGLKRSRDLVVWEKRDPIIRLYRFMVEQTLISRESFCSLRKEICTRILYAWKLALKAPYATEEKLLRWVYAP
ncbi:MAG: thiamine pyrophosphate-dependent dehydrogenase E1 component subunit alpha [Puniceicoccales bacterium]|jgi:pyruvate dehydrogenase E1 component alpha subunit|nr:thiamine pyrophosphate-dependent dehydrogenase E1 component subunit alpha [Puniceicoccales bacterium]